MVSYISAPGLCGVDILAGAVCLFCVADGRICMLRA